jgi:formylglycine-generating enzyme required for sulfatase activity
MNTQGNSANRPSLLTAILRGKGAIAQSLQQAIAVATRGVYVGGENAGIVNTGFQLIINYYRDSGNRKMNKRQLADNIQAYLEWMHGFCDQVAVFTDQPAPSIDESRIDLERIFVPLDVAESDVSVTKCGSCEHLLSLAAGRSLVLLGDAGQGKSITLLYLAHQLSSHLLVRRGWEETGALRKTLGFNSYADLAIPFYLPLNMFAVIQQNSGDGLKEYLDAYLQHESLQLPPDFFSAMIDHDKPVVLLLDGLDEILDNDLREKVAEHLRHLSNGKRNVRFVITSRPSAYIGHANTQMGASMAHYAITPFNNERLDRIVRTLYLALCAGSGADARKTSLLLEDIKRLEQQRQEAGETSPLIDSPLMAALAVQVREYTRQALPERRAEFLASAVEAMLNASYTQAAEERRLLREAVGGWQNHRHLLSVIALELHQTSARDLTAPHLRQTLHYTLSDAQHVEALIHFADSRGGLLRKQPDGRYRFIHLAIQQWLCAWRLIEQDLPASELAAFFVAGNHIAGEWWRETASLTAGLRRESATNAVGDNEALADFLAALGIHACDVMLSPAARFACAEVAVRAADEQLGRAHPIHARLVQSVASILDDYAALDTGSLAARCMLGDWVMRHGDPRRHVMMIDAMHFCYVPPGPFIMGSDATDPEAFIDEKCDEIAFNRDGITIPYGYLIGQHLITNAQYQAFITDDGYANPAWWAVAIADGVWQNGLLTKRYNTVPSDAITLEQKDKAYREGRSEERQVLIGPDPYLLERIQRQPNHPATWITWYEAIAFCVWLEAHWRAMGWLTDAQHVCLPNEPEWEKAARGGLALPQLPCVADLRNWLSDDTIATERSVLLENPLPRRNFPWGSIFDPARANVRVTNLGNTSAAGCFANGRSPYGCQDMSGNAWEWTRSLWGPVWFESHQYHNRLQFPYPYHTDDGREKDDVGSNIGRVLRGGSWDFNRGDARCSYRGWDVPVSRRSNIGFRVVVWLAPVR